MKTRLLFVALFSSFLAFSQDNIDITYEGVEVSGTTVYVEIDPNAVSEEFEYWTGHFFVTNLTGADFPAIITRRRVAAPLEWTDYVCWPPTCYTTSETDEYYSTPDNPAPILLDGQDSVYLSSNGSNYKADIKPQIYPDTENNSSATIVYYVENTNTGEYMDSVTVEFAYPLGVKELQQVDVNISPNPTNDYITINTSTNVKATVKIIDLLGNVVYEESLSNENVDVSNFKSGVYFVSLSGSDIETTTQKLLVR